MPLQSWKSNPNLIEKLSTKSHVTSRPQALNLANNRSTSLGGNLNSPDNYELFYTPRATFKQKAEENHLETLKMPEIALNPSETPYETPKLFDSNIRKTKKGFRRFDTTSPFKHPDVRDLLKSAKRRLRKITNYNYQDPHAFGRSQNNRRDSLSSVNGEARVQFALSQTPPVENAPTGGSSSMGQSPPHHPANTSTNTATHHTLSPVIQCFQQDQHRGELDLSEKYNYDLSRAQLKASSRTSALLAGFAMVCLVELQYDQSTPKPLLIVLGVVTSLLVSVHLLALMMSTCILPYMEATGCTQDSPHIKLKFYIDLSWLFSTCIGLLLFLVEIGVIFYVKFTAVGYPTAGYITTAMLVPVGVVFVVFSYLIHKNRVSHSLGRFKHKVDTMKQFLDVEANLQKSTLAPSTIRDI